MEVFKYLPNFIFGLWMEGGWAQLGDGGGGGWMIGLP